MVTPREAQVYVDGYYAGIVDDGNYGVFQRLHLPPGEHEIVLYMDGYRTAHQKVYLTPSDTLKAALPDAKNLAGETSEAPLGRATPAPGTGAEPERATAAGTAAPLPDTSAAADVVSADAARASAPVSRAATAVGCRLGLRTVIVRVQPAGAEIVIDGERWRGPEGDERLVVQLAEGTHRVEVSREGYRTYSGDVQVRRGETVPLNVALSPERD